MADNQNRKRLCVLKLEGDNYRQILAELETRGVKVETIREDNTKADKNSEE